MDGRLMWKFTSGLDFQNHSKTDRGSRCARIAEEIFAKTYVATARLPVNDSDIHVDRLANPLAGGCGLPDWIRENRHCHPRDPSQLARQNGLGDAPTGA